MSETNFTVDGFDNIVTIMREMPEDGYRKPVIQGFKKAALPVKRAMIASLPSGVRSLKSIIKAKPGKGKSMTLAVGAYGRQGMYVNRRGQHWDPYMLLYWHNYGTLSMRDPGHHFIYPRKKPSLNWKGGIRPKNFIDRAWESSRSEALRVFESEYEKAHLDFLRVRAAQ
jgi:hypothetical protein